MNKYELTLVLPGDASAAKKKAVKEKITSLIKILKGKIGKVEDWGKKGLAYKIAKNDSGFFLHFPLELESLAATQIDAKIRLDENIIRYLLIRA